jgi:hypothetical protein
LVKRDLWVPPDLKASSAKREPWVSQDPKAYPDQKDKKESKDLQDPWDRKATGVKWVFLVSLVSMVCLELKVRPDPADFLDWTAATELTDCPEYPVILDLLVCLASLVRQDPKESKENQRSVYPEPKEKRVTAGLTDCPVCPDRPVWMDCPEQKATLETTDHQALRDHLEPPVHPVSPVLAQ